MSVGAPSAADGPAAGGTPSAGGGTVEEFCGGDLLFTAGSGMARITLNRPDAANALTPPQRDAIVDLMRRCDEDRRIRAVVIGAAGRHFCGGADLRIDRPDLEPDVETPTGKVAGTVMKGIAYGAHRLIVAVQDCQKPVVAAVQGTAAGIGVQLALACDLVVMAAEASLIEVFVDRGLVPDGGAAYLLVRLAGLQRAKELMMLGERISAEKAQRYGLVTDVVPREEVTARAVALAARLASGPTVALGLMKRLANRALDVDRASALFEEATAQELVTTTVDTREALAAFVERRTTEFKGY